MSKILVDQIRSNSASSDALTLDGSGNVTVPGNITLSGNATLSGTATGFPTKATNLIINGAFQVAQRGTSSTSSGYGSVDRFQVAPSGLDEAATQAQVDVASGTTPYTLGFRKAFKITNGNQTSGAGAGDNLRIIYKVEAQDLANSGWNYTSSSSYITLSFWVKSSVAQNFYVQFRTRDTPEYNYTIDTGSLSADTWTKVTKAIPGNSNLVFNNDNGVGTEINFWQFIGTDYTGSMTLNQWGAYSGSLRAPDHTSTWYTTNDATFEITGVQLEVGNTATSFDHRSYAQELALCQRYYYKHAEGDNVPLCTGVMYGSSNMYGVIEYHQTMRAQPSIGSTNGTDYYQVYADSGTTHCTNCDVNNINTNMATLHLHGNLSRNAGSAAWARTDEAQSYVAFDAEL